MFAKRMGLKAAAKFSHRFATSHKAGVDIVRLLKTEAAIGPSHQQRAMTKLAEGAGQGNQIHVLMEKQKPYFPVLLTAMTAVGEETGKLDRALFILAGHLQKRLDTRNKFIRSIAWPGIQLVACVGVIALLILIMGMLPQMHDMLGMGLRGPSGAITFLLYCSLLFGAMAAVVWAFVRNVGGVQNLAPLVYMIPKLGPAIQTITISRFCWTMALALDAGLDPIRSIEMSLDSTGSEYYRAGFEDSKRAMLAGATLSGSLKATSLFPDDFLARVDIAEHSGTDAESMEYLAKEYDERANSAVRFLSGLATVVIRVTVTLVILYFMYQMLKPILGMYEDAQQPILPRRS